MSDRRIFTTLAMTVAKFNSDQIGEVLDTAFATPYVGGVMFQPLFASGRSPDLDPMDRVTTTGVLERIQSQSRNGVVARDLIALPCSHPDCCSIGYFVKGRGGTFTSLASLVGSDAMLQNLSLFGNTLSFSDSLGEIRNALLGVMSETMTLSRPELAGHLRTLCSACDVGGVARASSPRLQTRIDRSFRRRTRQTGDGQTLHGCEHDDYGTARAMLRARCGGQQRPGADAVLRRASVSKSAIAGAGGHGGAERVDRHDTVARVGQSAP